MYNCLLTMVEDEMTRPAENTDALKSWISLLRASSAIKKDVDTMLRSAFDVSISRFDVLSALERGNRNGLRAGELSRQLFVSDGNTTQVMSKLINEGYVLKRTDKNDARAVLYSLSDEGKRLFDDMASVHSDWIQSIFGELTPAEMTILKSTLDRLKPKNIDKGR